MSLFLPINLPSANHRITFFQQSRDAVKHRSPGWLLGNYYDSTSDSTIYNDQTMFFKNQHNIQKYIQQETKRNETKKNPFHHHFNLLIARNENEIKCAPNRCIRMETWYFYNKKLCCVSISFAKGSKKYLILLEMCNVQPATYYV